MLKQLSTGEGVMDETRDAADGPIAPLIPTQSIAAMNSQVRFFCASYSLAAHSFTLMQ